MTMRNCLVLLLLVGAPSATAAAQVHRGANVIQTENVAWGSSASRRSMVMLRSLGANTIAVVPFLYQESATADRVVTGDAVSKRQVIAAIRQAHQVGLRVLVKPHVWVPGTWAGAIEPRGAAAWQAWFASYSRELIALADVAQSESAEAFAVGVELRNTVRRPEWNDLIKRVRRHYKGKITFVADNVQEARAVPFWSQLDFISVSLYPSLGNIPDDVAMARRMRATLDSLKSIQSAAGKPVWVAEVGIRSAADAQREPWISAEERDAPNDDALQSRVIRLWLDAFDSRPWIEGVLLWRWFTDPAPRAKGDTDFAVQGKPVESVLREHWRRHE